MPKKKITNIKIAIQQLKDYCALQDRCQWDVIQKMREWNLMQDSWKNIIDILIQEKYVDEERYSRSFCRGKFKIKKWGKRKIINELRKKKISKVYIDKGLEEIEDNEYEEEFERQYHKKNILIKEKNLFERKKKIARFLINKGYEDNLVWNQLRKLKE